MAVVQFRKIDFHNTGRDVPAGVNLVYWDLADGDEGVPYEAPQFSGKVVQVTGNPGADGALSMKGSAFPVVTGHAVAVGELNNAATGDPLSFTTAEITAQAMKQVLEDCWTIWPVMTAGDGATAVRVYVLVVTNARR